MRGRLFYFELLLILNSAKGFLFIKNDRLALVPKPFYPLGWYHEWAGFA